jgi:flagellar hook-associated protein 2
MGMSLGGLASGMDTGAIIEQLVALEKQPIYRYESEISQLEKQKSSWRDINSRISSLGDKLTDLKFSSTYNSRKAVSSNEAVATAIASNDAAEANYDLEVIQLAQAERAASTADIADSTTDLASVGAGKISIRGTEIDIQADYSLNDIRDEINNTQDLGAKATIIDNNLVIESTETGTENSLNLKDVNGSVLADLGVNTIAGGEAQNAQVSINGIDVESKSNTIDQAVAGMKFELIEAGNSTIEVAKDTEKAEKAVQDFVDQYNSVMDFIDSKSNYNSETEEGAILQGDSTLMRVQSRLRQSIMDSVETGGDLSHISQIGISIDRDGTMSLDSDKLNKALTNDSEAVAKFFNAESSEDGYTGMANRLDGYIDQLIKSNTGLIPSRMESFDQRIDNLNDDIIDVEESVEMTRKRYTQQFTAMETALAEMQQQSSWMQSQLSSLGSQNLSSMLQ